MKTFLSPVTIFDLDILFQKKGWEINEQTDVKRSLYRRYCEILKHIEEDEQNLMIELSYRFEQVQFTEYLEFFLMSLLTIDESILNSKQRIIISPITKPFISIKKGDKKMVRPKTKSSQFLFYLLASQDLRWLDFSSKFEFLESINDIKDQYSINNSLLLLIDDYVGTGMTAVNCIKSIKKEIENVKEISYNDICVVSIAAQNEGVNVLNRELGVKVYSDKILDKGITDYYPVEQITSKIDLMLNIESKLKCPEEFSLGFGKSEALITFMNKTPNNTFPVYWHETEKKIAPFPRYKNFK